MESTEHRLCYPSLGNYDIAIKFYVERGAGSTYITPPTMTRRTVDLGAKYSPDFVCAPFKCHLGNYIEALEAGANVIIQTGGTCRLGYYGELHQQILADLGYECTLLDLNPYRYKSFWGLVRDIRPLADQGNLFTLVRALPGALRMVVFIDRIEAYYRENMGFEREAGAFDAAHAAFLADLRAARNLRQIRRAYKRARAVMEAIPLDKPEHPVRVGIVGEYFTIMAPFSNHEIERKLAKMGAEVHRWMDLSHTVLIPPGRRPVRMLRFLRFDIRKFPGGIWARYYRPRTARYLRYDTGSSSVATVALAEEYAAQGFDGIVHVKSFGCTPEMDVIPMLHRLSEDHSVPVLYLSYDTQTSDTGIETRVEAFYDMIEMRHHKE